MKTSDNYLTNVRKFLKKIPPLYNLFCTRKQEHKTLKRVVGFIYGFFLGILFYNFILVDLNFTEDAAFFVGLTICLMLAFGIAFSSQIRCITCLTFPSFGGKVGRSVLKTVVVAFIISGPVDNLASNGKEVVRMFACTATLTYNLTKTKFELMYKPFTEAIFGMKTDVNEVKDTIRSIKDVSAPITGEIEDESEMRKMKEENDYLDEKVGDTKRSFFLDEKYQTKGEQIEAERFEKQYLKKVEMRCESQFTSAGQKCRKMFENAYNKCYDTVTWMAAWLLCWPMKLDFVCNIVEAIGGASRCDPSKEIDPGFGEGYAYLKHSRESLSQNFKDVTLQYKIGKIKQLRDVRDARDTAVAVLHTINEKKSLLSSILVVVKRILAFVFLRIIIQSQNYHDKYLRDIEFDNIFITRYFRKIDARRKVQEKHTLLPLKKIERKKMVDIMSLTPLKSEREQVLRETAVLLLEMVTATILVLLDRLFYEALDLIRRHAKIDYIQTGRHDLMIEVKGDILGNRIFDLFSLSSSLSQGTGMIAAVLRSLVKGFNVKKRIRIEKTNAVCLPRPNLLLRYYIFKIYGTYFGIWVMMLIQAYMLRLRSVTCGYFYRKRQKKRILFLYNESLKRRRGFFRFMRNKVQTMARENRLKESFNVFAILRMNYPEKCNWLYILPWARRKCLVCGEVEPRKKNDFVECPEEACHFLYCEECWVDMGSVCLACEARNEGSSSGVDTSSEDDTDYY